MKRKSKLFLCLVLGIVLSLLMAGCEESPSGGSALDVLNTKAAANTLQGNQPTPTDINYSLERYNLIRRAYWVNGQHAKADALVCEVEKPLSYVVLYSGSTYAGSYVVDGKVSSLNSYLTPDSDFFEIAAGEHASTHFNNWIADIDGTYGQNDSGIFFFTVDGHYHEWTGTYHYSDTPIEVNMPAVSLG